MATNFDFVNSKTTWNVEERLKLLNVGADWLMLFVSLLDRKSEKLCVR